MTNFSYAAAFARNIGWLTEWEQDALRHKRVAIAGMGGVGGAHLLTLTRLGVGQVHIADFDTFDLANFNRQVGAAMSTIGRPKLDVMAEAALDINPELRLGCFSDGVTEANLDAFLEGVDLYVDGLDFFVLDVRRQVFARCHELGIPAITAAPIGMGTNWLVFMPNGMSFERYFRLEGQSANEQYLRFLLGLAPAGIHRSYLVDPSRVDLANKIGPSTGPSCLLCAGVVGVEAVKILLRREHPRAAPVHHLFDPYAGKFHRTKLRWGMNGPLQRLKLAIARQVFLRLTGSSQLPDAARPDTPIREVLDRARWAPSGDNAQPWSFEISGPEEALIHHRYAPDNIHEYGDGRPSLLAVGMLLETARLAASAIGRGLETRVVREEKDGISIRTKVPLVPGITPDPLNSVVEMRSVHRRALRSAMLAEAEKMALAHALSPELEVQWFETVGERWRLGRLSGQVTDIRLRVPELFMVHRHVIDWEQHHSPTGIPAQAVGLNRPTLSVMRWGMRDWSRMDRLNRLTGTMTAQWQLDLWPALRSSAFFAIRPKRLNPSWDAAAIIRYGAAVQRFWLTATLLGLGMQPATAILIFAYYGARDTAFTRDLALRRKAQAVAKQFDMVVGGSAADYVFIGRIGHLPPEQPVARSTRRNMAALTADLPK